MLRDFIRAPFVAKGWPFLSRVSRATRMVQNPPPKRYCHAMPILIDRFGGKELPSGYPYTQKKAEGMKKLMNFLWNTPVGRWLS
mgnify:CR=1 FL=1